MTTSSSSLLALVCVPLDVCVCVWSPPPQTKGLSAEAAAFVKGDEEFSITTFNVKTDYSMLGVEEVSCKPYFL